jgi:hypothetical protein
MMTSGIFLIDQLPPPDYGNGVNVKPFSAAFVATFTGGPSGIGCPRLLPPIPARRAISSSGALEKININKKLIL